MSPERAYVLIAISNMSRAALFRRVVTDSLKLNTTVVRDGEDALQEMSKRGAPSLLIVDLSLPRVDGFAVVRKLRRQTTDADTRIVVVAAHESLLAAARELSTSLSISCILPLDVDEESIREVVSAEYDAIVGARAPAAPTSTSDVRAVRARSTRTTSWTAPPSRCAGGSRCR